jgi:hypothetical protein
LVHGAAPITAVVQPLNRRDDCLKAGSFATQQAKAASTSLTHGEGPLRHHHHVTQSSHSINAIGPAPRRSSSCELQPELSYMSRRQAISPTFRVMA